MKQEYTSFPFPVSSEQTECAPFSYVAVRDGVAVASIFSNGKTVGDEGLPVVTMPNYGTFVSLFETGVIFINHEPVKAGTEWDGEKFLIPDVSDFVQINQDMTGE